MKETILAMQHLIDWIDEHAVENPGLNEMSKQIGYSPYYCSEQFHRVAGITIKEYMARCRLSMAALAIRDTNQSLMEIALDYGFSSQSALTRAFVNVFGCTPATYRRNPTPIPIQSLQLSLPAGHGKMARKTTSLVPEWNVIMQV